MTDLNLFVAIGSFFEGLVRFASWVLGCLFFGAFILTCFAMKLLFPKKSLWERSYMVQGVMPQVFSLTTALLCVTGIGVIYSL